MIIRKKEKSPIEPPDEKEVSVKLKNFGGVTPSVYLRILLAALIICALFLLLFFPGIKNEGTVLKVLSVPSGAAVSVNGTYVGYTPTKVFLPADRFYDVLIEKPGFEPRTERIRAEGRIFATLFFPVRKTVTVNWPRPDSPEELFAPVLAEFNDFAQAGREYSPSLRKQAARLLEPGYFFTETLDFFVEDYKDFLTDEEIETLLLRAAGLCGHTVTAQAVLKAYMRLHPDCDAVEAAALLLSALQSDNPRAAAVFRSALPKMPEAELPPPPTLPETEYLRPQLRPASSFSALGERWVYFEPQTAVTAAASPLPPAECAVGGFWIQDREVTAGLYRRFLADTPQWNADNAAETEKEGKTDAFYLRRFPQDDRLPAVSVSWHAAQAFCRWLERQNGFENFRARLPYSFEIELLTADDDLTLANINSTELKTAGTRQADTLRDLTGNAWEWCQNPPLRDPAQTDRFLLNLPTEIKAVKGGSFQSETVSAAETGIHFAVWSSPFTGFRVVLERR